ncbi:MAG: hypothetical protein IJU70_06980 [Lentisphaeria bacterium]|nr:hypothetical protein [Lentisphaeria bacterium]
MDRETLKNHLENAVHWLTGAACNRENIPIGPRGRQMPTTSWRGAIRGEYRAATRQWDSFCPVWHTGQAVKALVLAARTLNRPEWLEEAKFCAQFLLDNQFTEGENAGLIAAYEDYPDRVNTSAILECLDGLFLLSAATGDASYSTAALKALYWVKDHMWDAKIRRFYDVYDPVRRRIIHGVSCAQNRPLLDDAVFCTGWKLSRDASLLQVALDTAETLLTDEAPPGNWIKYLPCSAERDSIHPRHAYWWGNPMLDLFRETGDVRYKECFLRSVTWYRKALRTDGGLFRSTSSDFSTDSFGHATSGSACAAIMFLRYLELTRDAGIASDLERALAFCCRMQFINPADPALKGAVLEKVLPPDGTDDSPYHIRDLATIFFIQAASEYLRSVKDGLPLPD